MPTNKFGGRLVIKGGTDLTDIGNIGDRLKVDASIGNTPDITGGQDAFGRLRTSSAETLIETSFHYDLQTLLFDQSVTNSGTITHSTNKQAAILTCSTTTNSSAIFQSRQYMKYHPGKSSLVYISGNLVETATDVTKRVGLFDSANGMFFQLSSSTLSVVIRTSTSGSPVDTAVNQSSWNIDKLDGTGDSGITLDVTKQQIFAIDFQWLGSGRIRFGFNIDGKTYYCHEVLNANNISTIYSQFGDYPFRAEISNAGSTSSTLEVTCFTYIFENGVGRPKGILRTTNNGITTRSLGAAGSSLPLLSLRKQSAYVKLPIDILNAGIFADTSDEFLFEVVVNGTLTGASWTNVDGYCQQDVSATAISGGNTLFSTYLNGGSSAPSLTVFNVIQQARNIILGSDISGNSDIFTIKVTAVTASSAVLGFINYKELT